MQAKITLCIASDHVTFELLQPMERRGLRFGLQKAVAFLAGDDRGIYEVSESLAIPVKPDKEALQSLMQQGLSALKGRSKKGFKGLRLEVELGPAYSKLGLLDLDTDGSARFPTLDIESHAKAWVMHSWGVDPMDHIIRHSAVGHENKFLISCIDRQIVHEIQSFCATEQLKFTSCQPALAQHLDELLVNQKDTLTIGDEVSKPDTMDVTVFAERSMQSAYSNIVQFVARSHGELLSVSRVWFNSGSSIDLNGGLEEAICRLKAHHRRDASRFNVHLWPRVEVQDMVRA